ncbi:hypothetical protein UlMin_030042 [Ulmus minor]
MAMVAHFDLELHQMDVKTAFLNGDLYEDVYMTQPIGFKVDGKEHLVCKLKNSIYELKQASRQWYLKFDTVVTRNGFKENIVNQCIYMRVSGSSYVYLVLYVDDILLASNDKDLLFETKDMLSSHFDMKDLGDASYAPIVKGDKLSKAQCPQNDEERHHMKVVPYLSVVGSLMYAQLVFVMPICVDDKKSTTSYIFIMARGAISWKSAKQTLTASSTMELKNYPPNQTKLNRIFSIQSILNINKVFWDNILIPLFIVILLLLLSQIIPLILFSIITLTKIIIPSQHKSSILEFYFYCISLIKMTNTNIIDSDNSIINSYYKFYIQS